MIFTAEYVTEKNIEGRLRVLVLEKVGKAHLKELGELDEKNSAGRFLKVICYYLAYVGLYYWLCRLGPAYVIYFLVPMWALLLINFNRINVIVHDAAHYLIFNDKKKNDRITDFVAAFTCLHDVAQYRKSHNVHHRNLHEDVDPDSEFYNISFRKALEDIFFITFIKSLVNNPSKVKKKLFVYVYQVAILIFFVLMAGDIFWGVAYYVLCYLVPLLGLFVFLIRIRTYIQHHNGNTVQKITRTTTPTFAERLFIGQKMEYHLEHHLFPGIPYYNLAKLHDLLAGAVYQTPEFNRLITKTYLKNVH